MAFPDDIGGGAIPTILQLAGTGIGAAGDLARGNATMLAAQRKSQASEFEAEQLDQQAGQEVAASQRGAADEALKTALINSAALARAAASGAGASDPTVVAIMAKTAGMGSYRQNLALYQGEAQARLDNLRATADRYQASNTLADASAAQSASRMTAAATLFSGGAKAASLASKFWTSPTGGGGTGGGMADTSDYVANDWMSA